MVSIIVPVYNAETSLQYCINSILNQTYNNIEVILVNDGSTDHSGKLCESYANTNTNVKVIHQKNAGPSTARNTGIKAATGDFIQFVDADDYIEQHMTTVLVHAMTANIQLVICGYRTVEAHTTKAYIPSIEGIYQKTAFMNHFGALYKNTILPSPCNKLYRAEVINHHAIRFNDNLTIGEDLLFNMDYINTCTHVNILKKQLYHYSIVDASITRSFNKNLLENQKMLYAEVKAFLIKEQCYVGANEYFLDVMYTNMMINCFTNLFHKHSDLSSHQKKKQISTIISGASVQQQGLYVKGSLQSRFIGNMMTYKSINGIYWFFTVKKFLKYRLPPLFYLFKKINKKE